MNKSAIIAAMNTGVEWMIDAQGCFPEKLRDGATLRSLADAVINDLDLHVVGDPHWHQFPGPGGWTGMYLLSESHLTCHTFPETGVVAWNLFCCRPRPEWDWELELKLRLGASRVLVRRCERDTVGKSEQTSTAPSRLGPFHEEAAIATSMAQREAARS